MRGMPGAPLRSESPVTIAVVPIFRAESTKLHEMQRSLEDLASRSHGDDRPGCPILVGLGIAD